MFTYCLYFEHKFTTVHHIAGVGVPRYIDGSANLFTFSESPVA